MVVISVAKWKYLFAWLCLLLWWLGWCFACTMTDTHDGDWQIMCGLMWII